MFTGAISMAEELIALAEPKAEPPVVETPKTEAEPPKSYTQEDLDRISAKVRKNERYRTRKEVEAFYQGRESAAPRPEAPKPPVDEEPTRDKFSDYETFLEAKAAYVGKKVAREERVKLESETKARDAAEAQAKTFTSFQAKVREKFPDIEDRLESIGHIQLPEGMGHAIAEADLGPEILDHFASNPKDCERIASLTPSAALREIGKLEVRLEGAKTAAEKPEVEPAKPLEIKKPSVPAPIKPGGGSGGTADDVPKDTDTVDEWMRKERARERKKNA